MENISDWQIDLPSSITYMPQHTLVKPRLPLLWPLEWGHQAGSWAGACIQVNPPGVLCLNLWHSFLLCVHCRRLLRCSLAELWSNYIDPGTVLHRQKCLKLLSTQSRYLSGFWFALLNTSISENVISSSDRILSYCSLNNLFMCSFILHLHISRLWL